MRLPWQNVAPKLQPAHEAGCASFDAEHPPAPPERGKPFPRLCGMSHLASTGYDAYGVTMADFCRLLSDYLDRVAIDKTGITGRFDIHLDLSPADLGHPVHGLADDPTGPAARPDAGDISYSVRAAVQRLGLRLQPAKGLGEYLVIDHVERPSGN